MNRLLAIVGPTATGKSSLALQLAERLDGEIVNADSLQVYRGLDIGTAKPNPDDKRRVPHHLIDILEPEETYSAGAFSRLARTAIREIRGRSRLPIVVGGSGLYLRALLDGISPIPPVDPEIRAALRARYRDEGLDGLRRQLEALDPDAAERLSANDSQRTLRALEVVLSSGRRLACWTASRPFGDDSLEALRIGLTLPRDVLYDRVEARVGRMVDAGWVSEVAALLTRGVSPTAPAFQAIGYRQLAQHLAGDWSLEEALQNTIHATRRYAKRQQTWYRREREVRSFSAQSPQDLFDRVYHFVNSEFSHPEAGVAGEES